MEWGKSCRVVLYSWEFLLEGGAVSGFPANIQGADNKLGQFLDQDIEATANHRNVFATLFEKLSISNFT
jgi:hypothetical protein